MMTVEQVKKWLDSFADCDPVWIDETGVALIAEDENRLQGYLEIGGQCHLCECGREPRDCKTFDDPKADHGDRT